MDGGEDYSVEGTAPVTRRVFRRSPRWSRYVRAAGGGRGGGGVRDGDPTYCSAISVLRCWQTLEGLV